MITFKINKSQIARLNRQLQQYSAEKQKQLGDEVAKSAINIESNAKKITPVDTGRLRASIHTETSDSAKFTYSDSEGKSFDGELSVKPTNSLEAIVGTNVEYAAAVEFGLGGQRPQPYLRPAVEAERVKFRKAIEQILNK